MEKHKPLLLGVSVFLLSLVLLAFYRWGYQSAENEEPDDPVVVNSGGLTQEQTNEIKRLEAELSILKNTHGELSEEDLPQVTPYATFSRLHRDQELLTNWGVELFDTVHTVQSTYTDWETVGEEKLEKFGIDFSEDWAKVLFNPKSYKQGKPSTVRGIEVYSGFNSVVPYLLTIDRHVDGTEDYTYYCYLRFMDDTLFRNDSDLYGVRDVDKNKPLFLNLVYETSGWQQIAFLCTVYDDGSIKVHEAAQDLYLANVADYKVYPYRPRYGYYDFENYLDAKAGYMTVSGDIFDNAHEVLSAWEWLGDRYFW